MQKGHSNFQDELLRSLARARSFSRALVAGRRHAPYWDPKRHASRWGLGELGGGIGIAAPFGGMRGSTPGRIAADQRSQRTVEPSGDGADPGDIAAGGAGHERNAGPDSRSLA